jgi:pimeloyl-ACP methyl ester carboxylesterase
MWNRALGRRCLQAIAFAIEWPVLVVLRLHRFPKERIAFRLLSGRFAVIEVDLLGFGDSDRPLEYPQGGVHEQVLAVLDQEAVGYSQGGAMAASIAQATSGAAAVVCGGYALVGFPTDAFMRRMDRELRVPIASRTYWHCFKRFDWLEELASKFHGVPACR